MKKNIALLLLIINFVCHAQSEPETVRGKDMIDKIDRSEIESLELESPIELENEIPAIEFEAIEFEKSKPVKSNSNSSKVSKPVVTTKPPEPQVKEVNVEPVDNMDEIETENLVESVDVDNINDESDAQNISASEATNSSKKRTIMISNRKISLSNLELNDKIVVNNGINYVYRTIKDDTVQYRFVGTVPFESTGLKLLSENRYLVVDLDFSKSSALTSNPTTPSSTSGSENEQIKKVKTKEEIVKEFENKYNNGKEITKTIDLSRLLKNDIIHVSEDVQLVVRRNRVSYAIEYLWLSEKIDPNSPTLSRLNDFSFKVLKDRYEPSK